MPVDFYYSDNPAVKRCLALTDNPFLNRSTKEEPKKAEAPNSIEMPNNALISLQDMKLAAAKAEPRVAPKVAELSREAKTAALAAKAEVLAKEAKIAGISEEQFNDWVQRAYPEVWSHIAETRRIEKTAGRLTAAMNAVRSMVPKTWQGRAAAGAAPIAGVGTTAVIAERMGNPGEYTTITDSNQPTNRNWRSPDFHMYNPRQEGNFIGRFTGANQAANALNETDKQIDQYNLNQRNQGSGRRNVGYTFGPHGQEMNVHFPQPWQIEPHPIHDDPNRVRNRFTDFDRVNYADIVARQEAAAHRHPNAPLPTVKTYDRAGPIRPGDDHIQPALNIIRTSTHSPQSIYDHEHGHAITEVLHPEIARQARHGARAMLQDELLAHSHGYGLSQDSGDHATDINQYRFVNPRAYATYMQYHSSKPGNTTATTRRAVSDWLRENPMDADAGVIPHRLPPGFELEARRANRQGLNASDSTYPPQAFSNVRPR
jgi:hypothetical protein